MIWDAALISCVNSLSEKYYRGIAIRAVGRPDILFYRTLAEGGGGGGKPYFDDFRAVRCVAVVLDYSLQARGLQATAARRNRPFLR